MQMRKKLDNPGMPVRWRGPVPLAPESDAIAASVAAAKPDASQAAAAVAKPDDAAKKADADRLEAAARAAVEAAKKADADAAKVEAAKAEAAKKADADRLEAAKRLVSSAPEEFAAKLAERDRLIEERGRTFDQKAAALDAKYERARERAVISALRQMGANPDVLTDDDLRALAPKVDPDEPEGLAALARFAAGRPGAFKRAEVGPQERLAAYKGTLDGNKKLTDAQRARREKMSARLLGGGK